MKRMARRDVEALCRIALLAIFSCVGPGRAVAQAIPDGATPTSVTSSPSGRERVAIAPGQGGISRNSYSSFSVGPSGLDFDNRLEGARTIVNEVTSTRRSLLGGPIGVLGSRAQIVIANPNGITLDGASFANTGGVALSGGPVRVVPGRRPGLDDVVVRSGSDILVTGAGVSGVMTSLQLVASRLRIDGPVRNDHASPEAELRLSAGASEVRLRGDAVPGSTLTPWAEPTRLEAAADEILVDVTPRGSLSAGRVSIAVSGRGAGVAFAGQGRAGLGGFTIDAQGKVVLTGATLRAEKSVKITAASLAVLNSPSARTEVASLSGAVTLLALSGDIDITGQVTGAATDEEDPGSRGAVTLSASGSIRLLSEAADRLAIVFASGGELVVAAGGDVRNDFGRLLSNAEIDISAGGAIENVVGVTGAEDGGAETVGSRKGPRRYFGLLGPRRRVTTARTDHGTLRIADQSAYIAGQSVRLTGDSVVNSGEINALDGAVSVDAASILNEGVATGTVETTRSCGIVCSRSGRSSVAITGGAINATGTISLRASEELVNRAGQVTAYGNLLLVSPLIRAIAGRAPGIVSQPATLRSLFSGERSWVVEQPIGGQFIAPSGSILIETGAPVELAGGELIGANGTVNPAGTHRTAPAASRLATERPAIGLFRALFE